ncbi:NADPH-dependent FMN reductase [Corynebacterium ulceribovis]|uniref:NADPH-dependent FMN reductase n=1 Tax=Corynebacterium ulceribovis TaxID=487732 RepID=UPI00037267E4|nr:NAD(P)H-dependent oxidoreductase [Corynebacterium ulceribovis]
MKIAIIIGSTRPGNLGTSVGEWVNSQVADRGDAEFTLLSLADFNLDLLNEPTIPGAANGKYDNPKTQAWSDEISQYDGYIFVTPEYNHSVPAAMKNSFDVLGVEWRQKAVAFVGYGANDGVRAVEHWRQITANFSMLAVRNQVALNTFGDFTEGNFTPIERRAGELHTMVDGLVNYAKVSQQLRGA